jgi:hypothetical protein
MTVRECFGLRETKGDIGIEIEVEGRNTEFFQQLRLWRVTRDGSLRDGGVELVLPGPVKYSDLPKRLSEIVSCQRDHGIKVKDTGRAGVHIHMNMQEHSIAEVFNFVCAYLIFENVLIDYCGNHRVGNLFCLRASDAEFFVDNVTHALQNRDIGRMCSDRVRYASVNVNALASYGSLEFRAMRSTTDPDIVMQWVDLLQAVYKWSQNFRDPIELMSEFSVEGPSRVYDAVFGQRSPVAYDEHEIYEGARQAQLIAFCVENWDFDYYQEAIDSLRGKDIENYGHGPSLQDRISTRKKFFKDVSHSRALVADCLQYLENQEDTPVPRARTAGRGRVVTRNWDTVDDEALAHARRVMNRYVTEQTRPMYQVDVELPEFDDDWDEEPEE